MPEPQSIDLAFEIATNQSYLRALSERLSRQPVVGYAKSREWVGEVPTAGLSADQLGPLVARVALVGEDEDLGSAFYIGARHLSTFDHPVVSWAAPVAEIFFSPESATHDLADGVRVRRTLLERMHEIVKVFDDWVDDEDPHAEPFPVRALRVPAAPPMKTRERSRPAIAMPTQTPEPDTEASQGVVENASNDALRVGMRSTESVEYALNAPRREALTSVLSTLQPDQYDLATRSGRTPLVIQGHPGTGKTVIAIHRATYLVHPEHDRRPERLLLLGPTEEWVHHVRGATAALDLDGRVTVKSIPRFLEECLGAPVAMTGPLDGSAGDTARFVRPVLERAALICQSQQRWATGAGARLKNLERIYSFVRFSGKGSTPLQLGQESGPWAASLPVFTEAVRQRRFLPLLARAGVAIAGRVPATFDHVIVDEAQDVRGLEWELIRDANVGSGWTLVGDMNQRRSDHTDGTWEKLIERLGLTDETGPVRPTVIERGYRSTQAILNFAKPLLPRGERTALSLQVGGAAPTVTRATTPAKRDPLVVTEAERLLEEHPTGTVAVIGMPPDISGVEKALLQAGWRRNAAQAGPEWSKDSTKLAVRTPETSRGVEFDAVVVVEPAAFPKNLGRVGPLYTSLTRANRELAVVYSQALPDALRRHGRR